MLRQLQLLSWAAAATCGLLGATACGGDDPSSSPRPTAEETPHDEPVTLGDLLGTGGSLEDQAAAIRETDRQRQELIRDCMAEQGFDYVVHVAVGQVESPQGLPTDLTDEEFRRQYGYGIATGFESSLRRSPGEPDAAEDPNVAIVAAMSPAERAAYEQALHGSEGSDGTPGGCEGKAFEATDQAGRLTTEFGDQLEELSARVDADSRVVEAEKSWTSCMEEAGYPYADERAVRTEILHRLNPLNDAVMGEDIPEGAVAGRAGLTLTKDQQAQLAEIRTFELTVAKADQDCRDDLDEVRKEVRAEYEAEFVDANRDRLRELFPDAGL